MITTLVIGAGISCDYGYPTGAMLKNQIIELLQAREPKSVFLAQLEALDHSSIDAFMEDYPLSKGLIAPLIAELIARQEKLELIEKAGENIDFYRLLFKEVKDVSSLRIVTFNYDRSLERYYWHLLSYRFPEKSLDERYKLFLRLNIVHVHGRLPSLPCEELHVNEFIRPRTVEYGDYANASSSSLYSVRWAADLHEAAKRFNFAFGEGQVDETALAYLRQADRIFFIGFSYHEFNMKKIGFDHLDLEGKTIAGTTHEMDQLEIRRLEKYYSRIRLRNVKAIEFFRNNFSLKDPMLDDRND